MGLPEIPSGVGGSQDGGVGTDTLGALLPEITRAVTGMRVDREIYDAAMAIVGRSRVRAMLLTRPADRPYMEATSQSMGGVISQTVRNLSGQHGGSFRFELSQAPTLRRALSGLPTQPTTIPNLCRELFGAEAGMRVVALLGGKAGHAAVSPVRCGQAVAAALVLTAPPSEPDAPGCSDAIAASLGAALTFARLIRRVDRVRALLPADHRARRSLRDATDVPEVQLSQGHFFVPGTGSAASLVPYRLTQTTVPPPMPTAELPHASGAAPALGAAPAERGPARAAVLLVEDERRLRESTAALLSGLGYNVEAVSSGEEAVAAYSRARDRAAPFDVVLLDETLGGNMRGTEALRILRSMQGDVRAIQLSGLADRTPSADLERQGFVGRLNKPVSMEQLNNAIERALVDG